MLSISTKAQAWYVDFILGISLFIAALVIYYNYIYEFSSQEENSYNKLIDESSVVSSSLVTSGFPNDWNNSNVVRIGLADETKINRVKLKSFKRLNYSKAKSYFGIVDDYFVFFTDKDNQAINVYGTCGIGSPLANSTFKTRTAYYYQDPLYASLKDPVQERLNADIYFSNIDELILNINSYDYLIMETANLNDAQHALYSASLDDFVSNGGKIFVAGKYAETNGKDNFGSSFFFKADQSPLQRNSTANITDFSLDVSSPDLILFRQAAYINPNVATDFRQVASFNSDNQVSIGSWKYGAGSVYFASDSVAEQFDGNFTDIVADAAATFMEGYCHDANLSKTGLTKIARTKRYVFYNSRVIGMVVYAWQ